MGFHYIGSHPSGNYPNFVVIAPSTGMTPTFPESTSIGIALDPRVVPYLPCCSYSTFVSFAVNGQSTNGAAVSVTLDLNSPPPVIQSVVNAATLQPVISPGEIVSIFGSHLGTAPVTAHYDEAGLYPTDLSHQVVPYPPNYSGPREGVTFNGVPAPLLYYSSNQINAIVPYEVAGQASVNIVVTHYGQTVPFPVPVKDTAPGIFTASQNGTGQGAILNADGTLNSASNPAPKGSAITLFATGAGVLQQQTIPDGSVLFGGGATCSSATVSTSCKPTAPNGAYFPAAPVSVTIGGQPAPLLYVGPSPGSAAALLQINALVPNGIGSGSQPVVLMIGQNNNAQQQVTIVVQ
ncbi:MAG TPA: hypothetical protein VH640_18150 [Bryobacteraceae bacterium]